MDWYEIQLVLRPVYEPPNIRYSCTHSMNLVPHIYLRHACHIYADCVTVWLWRIVYKSKTQNQSWISGIRFFKQNLLVLQNKNWVSGQSSVFKEVMINGYEMILELLMIITWVC